MKKYIIFLITLISYLGFAQNPEVLVNSEKQMQHLDFRNSAKPYNFSAVNGSFEEKTETQILGISTPKTARIVYNSTKNEYYYYNGVIFRPFDTDKQTLSLASNILSISNGNNVNLSSYLDNTDNQDLTLTGDVLSLTNDSTPVTLPYWRLGGNAGTNAGTNSLGTLDAQDLVFKANNVEMGRVNNALQSWNFAVDGLASGQWSYNSGRFGTAIGIFSFNSGLSGNANANFAFNSGSLGVASGEASFNSGRFGTASGQYAFNSGNSGTASGNESFNSGCGGATASGLRSFNSGYFGNAIGGFSFNSGQSGTASGNNSFNTVRDGFARSFGEHNLGTFSTDYTPANTTDWSANDRLLNVGNGTGTTARSDAFTILKNGNTGIGINTPAQKLHIGTPTIANTGGIRLPITSTSPAQTGQPIGVDANGDIVRLTATTFDATVSFSTVTPTTAGVVFSPNTPANTTVLYVSSIDGSQWTYNGTTYVTQPASADWKTSGNSGTVQATNFLGTTDNVGLSLRTNNTIRQTITNNGNVGIGTTAPTLGSGGAGLNILNNSFTQLRLQSSSMSAGIEFKPSTGNEWELQASNSNQFFVYNRTKNQYRLLIDEIGNVGIGTVTPTAKLEVAGTVKIVDGTQGVGKVLTSDATGLATWQSKGFFQAQNVTGGWGASGKTVLTFTNKANTNYLVTVNASFYSTISSLQTLNLTNNGIQVLAINQFFNTTNNHTSVGGSFVLSTTAIVSNVLALKTTANSDFNDFCTITVVEL